VVERSDLDEIVSKFKAGLDTIAKEIL
jgi:hypothetical protein